MAANETLSRPDRSLRLQCVCTLLVAVGAAYVSYRHGREFALRYGADDTAATLWPLIVDGLMLTATIELWKINHGARATGQWKAWLSFILGIGLSLTANIASAPGLNPSAVTVAACPPLALLLSVELLNQALKRRHATTDSATDPKFDENRPAGVHATNSGEVGPSPEAPEKAEDVPALRTMVNSAPGHNADHEHPIPQTPHGEGGDPLREQAYRLDAEHWNLYRRPISADTLRQHLHVGSRRARALTRQIRKNQSAVALTAVQ